jgi:hypothetical protein
MAGVEGADSAPTASTTPKEQYIAPEQMPWTVSDWIEKASSQVSIMAATMVECHFCWWILKRKFRQGLPKSRRSNLIFVSQITSALLT